MSSKIRDSKALSTPILIPHFSFLASRAIKEEEVDLSDYEVYNDVVFQPPARFLGCARTGTG